jgi:hypothetical protein
MSIHLMEVVPEVNAEYARMVAMQAVDERRAIVEAKESKSAYKRPVDKSRLTGFETVALIDSATICRMIKKVSLADLVMALTGAEKRIKESILGNMPEKLREVAEITVCKMESGLLPYHVIERCRDIISDAFLEIMREETK